MTKEQFLARCANAFDMGLATPERISLLSRWVDVVMREGHSRMCDWRGKGEVAQWDMVVEFWSGLDGRGGELARLAGNEETPYLRTLANDTDGYGLVQLVAVLSHPCQKCALDPNAWHTRFGFCSHKRGDDEKPTA